MASRQGPVERRGSGEQSSGDGGICPLCGKPAVAELAPFCSTRCADVDLHRWLGGVYAVPTDEPGEDEEGA